jgi:hypothetical protein
LDIPVQYNESEEPFSAATTATFGGPRQMPEDEEEIEDDFTGFNGDPKDAVVQPLVRTASGLSRNDSCHSTTSSNNRVPTDIRRSSSSVINGSSSSKNLKSNN